MKKVFTHFLALGSLTVLMLTSCKKDEKRAVLSNDPTASTLTTSTSSLALIKANANNNAVTFTIQPANFGYSAAMINTLQIDVKGDNFANPQETTLDANAKILNLTTLALNTQLINLGLPTETNAAIEARIKTAVSGNGNIAPVYSNVLSMTVSPYDLYMYVIGAYNNNNISKADTLVSVAGTDDAYSGIANITGNNLTYKVSDKKETTVYGDAGNGTISMGASSFTAPASGYIKINIDLTTKTYISKAYTWSVIGDATPGGWNSDTDMKYYNKTGKWSVTVKLTSGGSIKFRLNHDWGTNLGVTKDQFISGGDNIAITASGTYTIILDPEAPTYSITKVN